MASKSSVFYNLVKLIKNKITINEYETEINQPKRKIKQKTTKNNTKKKNS